jgi:hypothetical protein
MSRRDLSILSTLQVLRLSVRNWAITMQLRLSLQPFPVLLFLGFIVHGRCSDYQLTCKNFEDKYPKVFEEYESLSDLVSPKSQYANYRKVLKTLIPPAIPFLGKHNNVSLNIRCLSY